MIDRRRNRSQNARQALSLFLDAQRKRLGVHAITVANERGELVAGSGVSLRSVAAAGTRLDEDADGSEWLARAVATWRMRVNGRYLVVTSMGRKIPVQLGEGVRRILSR
ncbi:MAG: hypothetical protein ACOC1F_10615 [Myxococcota bacterium]